MVILAVDTWLEELVAEAVQVGDAEMTDYGSVVADVDVPVEEDSGTAGNIVDWDAVGVLVVLLGPVLVQLQLAAADSIVAVLEDSIVVYVLGLVVEEELDNVVDDFEMCNCLAQQASEADHTVDLST